MENAQKAIMVGVGLFITIIIISAVMLISSAGQDIIDQSMSEVNNLSDSLSRQLYSDFAGSTLSGTQVISAIKKYAGSKVTIGTASATNKITTDSNGKITAISYDKKYTATNSGAASDDIVSTGEYTSYVKLDQDSKYVTDIVFVRK